MGISSILVDRAHAMTYTTLMQQHSDGTMVPVSVEGAWQMEWVAGQWFSARLTVPEAAETPDASGGHVRPAQHATLLFDLEDEDGNPVVLHADDRVVVESEELGTHTFELTGEPQVYRKKVSLILGEAHVVRVLDGQTTPGRVTQRADQGTQPIHLLPSGS